MNTNGVISFNSPIYHYTPQTFPRNVTDEIIIAPFWADVDIRGTGNIGYRETRNPDLLQRANNDIRRAFPTIRFSSEYLFIATWDHVGYYYRRVEKVRKCMQGDTYQNLSFCSYTVNKNKLIFLYVSKNQALQILYLKHHFYRNIMKSMKF